MQIARETAGAARTRSSLRPDFEGKVFSKTPGASRRENAKSYSPHHCEERSGRSNPFYLRAAKWIASLALAMTAELFESQIRSRIVDELTPAAAGTPAPLPRERLRDRPATPGCRS